MSLVGINQSDDFILLGFCFDLRIKLNSWPERLMLLIKVSLRTELKFKEFARRSRASEHPLTPFPGVSWKQRKIKRGTIQKGFHAFLWKSEYANTCRTRRCWNEHGENINFRSISPSYDHTLTDVTVVEKVFPRKFSHLPWIELLLWGF